MKILSNVYAQKAAIGLYVLVQGYFLGLGLIWTLPNILHLPWPYYLVPGYGLGLLVSTVVAYMIFKKWHTTKKKKAFVALISLIVAIAAGGALASLGLYLMKARISEELGATSYLF